MRQVIQARDLALDALLDQVDIPLPESVVAEEAKHNRESIEGQLSRAGATLDGYLEMTNQTEEQFEADIEQRAQRAVKVSLVLDQLARNEELGVDPAELTAYVTRQAEQMGVSPDRLAQQLADNNQINIAAAEVLRGKAMNVIAERVKVTDSSGNPVDIAAALNTPLTPAGDVGGEDGAGEDEVMAATEADEADEADEAEEANAKA
jgi:trigger factor